MLKPASLKKALFKSVPLLRQNPDMLRLFIDNGAIDGTLAASLSFENRYSLDVTITDYTGDMNMLLVPVAAWEPARHHDHRRGQKARIHLRGGY
jgi:hypothetical protein